MGSFFYSLYDSRVGVTCVFSQQEELAKIYISIVRDCCKEILSTSLSQLYFFFSLGNCLSNLEYDKYLSSLDEIRNGYIQSEHNQYSY